MNLLDAVGLAGFLIPEIVLAGLTFGVLLLDILRRKIGSVQNASVEYRHEFLGRVVLAGLAVTFLLYLVQLGQTPMGTLGQGAFVASSLNTIFKLLVVALTFVTVVFGLQTPYSSH